MSQQDQICALKFAEILVFAKVSSCIGLLLSVRLPFSKLCDVHVATVFLGKVWAFNCVYFWCCCDINFLFCFHKTAPSCVICKHELSRLIRTPMPNIVIQFTWCERKIKHVMNVLTFKLGTAQKILELHNFPLFSKPENQIRK